MSSRFSDQIVVISGATSGIGRECALAFGNEGATVVGTGRDQTRLAELAPHVDLALTLDVTENKSVEIASQAILDRYGRVDVLINNAGIGLFRPWQDTDVADVQRIMDVNLYGVIRLTRAVLPSMLERDQGTVVNIASVAGKRGYAKHTAYCASKHALIGWSEGLRCDLSGTGVHVVIVCPPAVRTPFFENAGYMTFDQDHPDLTPMTPQEVAAATVEATFRHRRTTILSPRARALYAASLVAPGLLDRMRGLK
jgi:short-subunit dehydrogenase